MDSYFMPTSFKAIAVSTFPSGDYDILFRITIFIAWLNLDLGIETCFYDGMDACAYTWLQYLFPFYLWLLIGMIIVATRYSRKIASILGKNPVATLVATLFYYFKLLNSVVTPLSYACLEYLNETEYVWLYDGNVKYFAIGNAKHIALGVFAIFVLIFLVFPYTFLLLFSQWLQAYSHRRVLSWLNKIKPFMDAYHAPYKKETRYWTGPILLIQSASIILRLLLNNDGTILSIITSITFGLAALAWVHNGIYEARYNRSLFHSESGYLFSSHIQYTLCEGD